MWCGMLHATNCMQRLHNQLLCVASPYTHTIIVTDSQHYIGSIFISYIGTVLYVHKLIYVVAPSIGRVPNFASDLNLPLINVADRGHLNKEQKTK